MMEKKYNSPTHQFLNSFFTKGQFNVLTMNLAVGLALLFSAMVSAQTANIRTGFEGNVTLSARGSSDLSQLIQGTDNTVPAPNDWTAFTNSYGGGGDVFLNYIGLPTSVNSAIVNDPTGGTNQVLRFTNVQDDNAGCCLVRCQLELRENNVLDEIYSTQRVYLPSNLGQAMSDLEESNDQRWFNISEHRGAPDHLRIQLEINGATGVPKWKLLVYDILGGSNYAEIWEEVFDAPVPLGEWFTLEQYYKYGSAGNGRAYVAIITGNGNRTVLIDEQNRKVQSNVNPSAKLGNWHPLKNYVPVSLMTWYTDRGQTFITYRDDFEFWNGFPPGHPENPNGGDTTPPPTPSLNSPADNASTTDTTPTFSWNSVSDPSGINRYDIEIDGNVINAGNTTSYTSAALALGNHNWRVRAVDGANNVGSWSALRTLTVIDGGPDTTPPPIPSLNSPADNASTTDTTPTFSWNAVTDPSGIDRYDIEIDGNVINAGAGTSYTSASLTIGNHNWRIRAVDGANNIGNWSALRTLVITVGGGEESLGPIADTYARGGTNGNNNYGTASVLVVKRTGGDAYKRRSYLKFDLSSLSGTASNATLRLQVASAGNCTVRLLALVDDSWTETGLTWNTRPTVNTGFLVLEDMTTSTSTMDFDVTSAVNQEISGDGTITFMLYQEAEESPYISFHSRESSNDPQLIVGSGGTSLRARIIPDPVVLSRLYPNPAFSIDPVHVVIEAVEDMEHTWSIFDLSGMKVKSGKGRLVQGNNTLSIDFQGVSTGLYVVKINPERGEEQTYRVLIKE